MSGPPRYPQSTQPPKEAALWRLAERLYDAMDRLDPTGEDWSQLSDLERSLFYFSIKSVLLKRSDVLDVLEINLPNNNPIERHHNL